MKPQTVKRTLSLLLTLAMLLGLLPGLGLPALAAAPEENGHNVSSVDNATLNRLNLATDETALAKAAANSDAPAGTTPFSIYTINELMVSTTDGQYFNDLPDSTNVGGGDWGVLPNTLWQNGTSACALSKNNDTVVRSAALDLTVSGKKDHIAQLQAVYDKGSKTTTISLQILDGANKKALVLDGSANTSMALSKLPFELYPPHASAFLSIAAGDFDGDKQDEIAVYVPMPTWKPEASALPSVRIYKYDQSSNTLNWAGDTLAINGSNAGFSYESEFTRDVDQRLPRMYPAVSLAAVENTEDGIDDLAVGVSHMRHGNDDLSSTHSASTVVFWRNPGVEGKSSTWWDYLHNSWADYKQTPATNYEAMLFPGVASGDIDNDGKPDVVVAGYRISSASSTSKTWTLDDQRYLITYYSLVEQGDGSYRYEKQVPLEWISINGGNYNGALNMDSGFINKNDAENRVVNPLEVAVFAERGTGFNKSIFVNGFVVNLPTVARDADSTVNQDELQLGKAASSFHPFGSYSSYVPNDQTKSFRIRYAAPLRGVDTALTTGSVSAMRNVMEVAVGNFDGNGMGREQVMFTYIVRHQGSGQAANLPFSIFVCGLSYRGAGESKDIGNKVWDANKWRENAQGVKFDAVRVASSTRGTAVTIAAPDVDGDSVLMRYANKPADFYFSDPQIIAVMQAAPYFADLAQVDELGTDPDTSFVKTGGTSTSQDQAVTIHGMIGLGFSAELPVSAGFIANIGIDAVDAETMARVSGEAGWAFNRESAREVSTSFSAGYDDTVALTMTPTVRHYYERFDPVNGWTDAFIDVPETPKTSQVSVDIYDEVAQAQGWPTLRDSVLHSAVAGYPSTYRTTPPSGVQWAGTERDNSSAVGEFIKVGTGGAGVSKSVSKSLAHANGVNWGAGMETAASVKLIAIKGELEAGVDYTGGFSWSTFSGTEFSGTVPDIAGYRAGDYSFDWAFGAYTATMPNAPDKEFVVLNYLVKDVRNLPLAPLDVEVQSVTADSVTLRWSDRLNGNPLTYEVCRVLGNNYYPLGTVQADDTHEYTYTDTQCDPNTEYTYAVRAYAYASGLLRSSNYSAPVTAITRLADGATVTGPEKDVTANSGERVTLAVAVQGGSRPAYKWQYRPGEGAWTDLVGKNQPQLTLNDITTAMDGYQYRCVVMPFVGNVIETIYSDAATLHVDKRDTATTLTLSAAEGNISEYVFDPEGGRTETSYSIPLQAYPAGQEESRYSVMTDGTYYYLMDSSSQYYTLASAEENTLFKDAVDRKIQNSNSEPISDGRYDYVYFPDEYHPTLIHTEQYFYQEEEKTTKYDPFTAAILNGTATDGAEEVAFQDGFTTSDYVTYTEGGHTLYQAVKTEVTNSDGEDPVTTTQILYFVKGEGEAYTQLWLGDPVYHTGESATEETTLQDFAPDQLTMAMVKVLTKYGSYFQKPGTKVTFTAEVHPEGGGVATGGVAFNILNTTSGTRSSTARKLENGAAAYEWVASEAGIYQITAEYGGSDLFNGSHDAASYTAKSQSQWLVMNVDGSATYGDDPLPVELLLYVTTDQGIPFPSPVTGSYGLSEITGKSKESTINHTPTSLSIGFKKPGTYTFRATYFSGSRVNHTADKTITVAKKPLTVEAQSFTYKVGEDGLDGVTDPTNLKIDGLLDADSALGDIFYLAVDLPTGTFSPKDLPMGTYPIRILVKDGEENQTKYAELKEKYDFIEQNGVLTVTNDKYKVEYEHDVNGALAATVDGTAPLSSGDQVYKGSGVAFTATPDKGFTVDGWTVNGEPVPENEVDLSADGRLLSIPALEKEIKVAVGFTPAQWEVSFGVRSGSADKGTLVAETAAGPVASPIRLAGSTWIEFTAEPIEGFTVANWYVDGEAQNVYGNTFRVDVLEKDTKVEVEFQEEESFTVTVGSSGPGTVQLFDADGRELQSPATVKSHGSVTAKAVPIGGASVTKWIATGAPSQGASDTYVLDNVTGDVTLTAVFTPIASYAVSYALEGGGAESISAQALGQDLGSGGSVAAGAEVTFTVTGLGEHRQVSQWKVNGQAVPGASGATYACKVTGKLDVTACVTEIQTYSVSYRVVDTPTVGDGYNGTLAASYTTPRDDSLTDSEGPGYEGHFPVVEEFAQVTLAAEPAPGYRVKEWTVNGEVWKQQDDTDYRGKVLELTVQDGDIDVTVEFEADNNNLTFAPVGHGGLAAELEGGGPIETGVRLENGTQVVFTASADEGYELTGWKLDGSLITGGDGEPFTSLTYTHAMDGSAHVEAVFQGRYVTVEATASEGGSAAITSPADVSGGQVRRGTDIQVQATPEPGYELTLWQVDGESRPAADNPLAVTVSGDMTIRAQFSPIPYTLTFGVADGGTGSGTLAATVGGVDVESGQEHDGGQEVVLTASPAPGSRAVWTRDGSPVPGVENVLTFPLAQDTVVSVTFEAIPTRALTVSCGAGGAYEVTANGEVLSGENGSYTVLEGDLITVAAKPDPYYRVLSWTVDGTAAPELDGQTVYSYTVDGSNRAVEISFRSLGSYDLAYSIVDEASTSTVQGYLVAADGTETAIDTGFPRPMGSKLLFRVTPGAGRMVEYWTVNGERVLNDHGTDYVLNEYSRTLTGTLSVEVHMAAAAVHTVTFSADPAEGGSVTATVDGSPIGSGSSVRAGATVLFQASANSGYRFGSFQSGQGRAAEGQSWVIPSLSGDAVVTASFSQYTPSPSPGPSGGGTPPAKQDTTITEAEGDKLIVDAVENGRDTIIIDAETPKVSLPSGFLTGAGGKTKADILITTPIASIRLPNGALGGLASLGGEITVQATLTKSEDGEQVLTLGITADGKTVERVLGGVKVTVPYDGGSANTVAILRDGRKVLPKSFVLGKKMTVPLDGPDTAVLTDNPKDFPDTESHWGEEYIDFVTSHELFQGTDKGAFTPDDTMTRGMLWTVLSRMEGAETAAGPWYAAGMAWAKAAGVSDGSDPEGDITREQLAVMLWRVAGSPAATGKELNFADASDASSFADEALRWATELGILTGKGDGSLDPLGSATRAEVSAMLMRFICQQ